MSKDKIIDDLARAKPKGPRGTKIEYSVEKEFDYDSGRYRKIYTPLTANYGYTDEQIFKLGFVTKTDVCEYLRSRDFDGVSNWGLGRRVATLTRRTNKIWDKINGPVRRVLEEGRPGIYRVTSPYATHRDFGHIYAESLSEAQQNAEMFYGYLVPTGRVRANFLKIAPVQELSTFNDECKKGIEKSIAKVNQTIESQKEALESLNSRLSTMNLVEQQQISVEMKQAIKDAAILKEKSRNRKTDAKVRPTL